jgi:hypothetical protein
MLPPVGIKRLEFLTAFTRRQILRRRRLLCRNLSLRLCFFRALSLFVSTARSVVILDQRPSLWLVVAWRDVERLRRLSLMMGRNGWA